VTQGNGGAGYRTGGSGKDIVADGRHRIPRPERISRSKSAAHRIELGGDRGRSDPVIHRSREAGRFPPPGPPTVNLSSGAIVC